MNYSEENTVVEIGISTKYRFYPTKDFKGDVCSKYRDVNFFTTGQTELLTLCVDESLIETKFILSRVESSFSGRTKHHHASIVFPAGKLCRSVILQPEDKEELKVYVVKKAKFIGGPENEND